MKFGKSSNPAISLKRFDKAAWAQTDSGTMTVSGTVNKTGILLLVTLLTASFTWRLALNGGNVLPWMIGGFIGGFVFALITIFSPKSAKFTAPIYAALEGLALGGVSALFSATLDGVVLKAVFLTFGILFMMLFTYKTGIIKATDKFKRGVIAAGGAVMLIYLVNFILSLFGINMPFLHDGSTISIIISLVIIVIAALFLILDFDAIEKGAQMGAPKYMEWYSAFGLMLTLVWLYLEILQLVAMLSGND